MARGVAGCPRRVGSGKQKTGKARFLVGAREGEALPLIEFEFDFGVKPLFMNPRLKTILCVKKL
ncbi:hypothetical protein R80B4_00924 [Fibrobacteres bacterium R8-0-B4]